MFVLIMFEYWVFPSETKFGSYTDLSSALVGMLMSSSKLFLFSNGPHLNSGMRLLLELYGVILIKRHVVFFTICAKLIMADLHLPVYL